MDRNMNRIPKGKVFFAIFDFYGETRKKHKIVLFENGNQIGQVDDLSYDDYKELVVALEMRGFTYYKERDMQTVRKPHQELKYVPVLRYS